MHNRPSLGPEDATYPVDLFKRCSNAGRWGADDELGTLNFITPEKRVRAAALVQIGKVVSIGLDLDLVASRKNPTPPRHTMLADGEDALEITPHGFAVTHLDAVGHVAWEGHMYNGRRATEVVGTSGLRHGSIYAMREGLVTRGVFLDVAGARGRPWLDAGEAVHAADLNRAESLAGVRVERGDAVLVRVGLGARERVEGPEDPSIRAGLAPDCLPWLYEHEVALYGGDCIERLPSPAARMPMPLHMIGLAAMGLALLDCPDMEALFASARALVRNEFLFTCAPLRIVGGTGSAVNPLCIF